MAELEDMMDGVFGLFDEHSETQEFRIGKESVIGHFQSTGTGYEKTDNVKKLKARGMFAVSRTRLTKAPAADEIILGPGGTRFRVEKIIPDAAGWTFVLCSPE